MRTLHRSHRKPLIVLCVDDNEDGRKLCARFFNEAGFIIVEAADGLQALKSALTLRPSLVVMDLNLPKLDGWQTTRLLKADARTRNVPVIALSANVFPRHRIEAELAGCDAFLEKPVHLDALRVTTTRLLAFNPFVQPS
ncbi:MAG: response regulator [Polyangiaceae bacterium]